jgi:nitrate reductase beta subunit
VQYTNGLVDFVSANCIGGGYCVKGCPFNIPRISKVYSKAYKCTLCSDRVEGLPELGKHNAGQKLVLLFCSGLVLWDAYFAHYTSIDQSGSQPSPMRCAPSPPS